MKQLLIVNSANAAHTAATKPSDLSALKAGAIGVYELGEDSFLSAAASKDFAIALGRPNNSSAFLIPEVDFATLKVTIAEPKAGVAFNASITIPNTVADGGTYTLVLVKKGAVPHERNTWTATTTISVGGITSAAASAAAVATALTNYFKAMAETGSLPINVSANGATITIQGVNAGEGWVLKAADDLAGTAITVTAEAEKAIGDMAYVKDLASRCAAGKGFVYTEIGGQDVLPGYPEAVEDTTYGLITLRFAVGRKSAKTRDERVSQLVHIACPSTSADWTTLKTIFTIDGKTEVEE